MKGKRIIKSMIIASFSAVMVLMSAKSLNAGALPGAGVVSDNDIAMEASEDAELIEEGAALQTYNGIPAAGAPGSDANCSYDYMNGAWMPAVGRTPVDTGYNTVDAFKKTTTKKGVQSLGDVDATSWNGSQHTLYNVLITDYFWSPDSGQGKMRWDYNGNAYYYNVSTLFALVQFVQTANQNGVTVSLQMEVPYKDGMEILIDPTALANRGSSQSEYYAPNTGDGARYFEAFFDMMTDIFSRTNCHVDNWILGNEVNAPNSWHFSGNVDTSYNVNLYTKTYLQLYNAVRRHSSVARVSVCLDHSWQHDDVGRAITTKDYLNTFNLALAGTPAASDWCLAYHMYPSILAEPDIWTVNAHVTAVDLNPKSTDARLVDGYNYHIMTEYIKNTFGTQHRIMCTEEGFSDVFGDNVQAASMALSYYAAKYDSMTDCFILACKNAGANVNFDIRGKLAEAVYLHLDDNQQYVESVTLPTIGISSYAQVVPGYGRVVDETKIRAFVTRIYKLALGREPEAGGLDYLTNELATGAQTGAEVAGGFFFSEEMKQKNLTQQQFLNICYTVMMDRTADAAGSAYWINTMENGFGKEGVFNNFCMSAEFNQICNTYGITPGSYAKATGRSRNIGLSGFMSRLYTKALGRNYDEGGMDYWCEEITQGNYTLMQVSTEQFFHSKEFLAKNLNNTEYVKVLYRTFFDREYDQAGLDYWLSQLASGKDRDFVLEEFARSKEFAQVKASYGL